MNESQLNKLRQIVNIKAHNLIKILRIIRITKANIFKVIFKQKKIYPKFKAKAQ